MFIQNKTVLRKLQNNKLIKQTFNPFESIQLNDKIRKNFTSTIQNCIMFYMNCLFENYQEHQLKTDNIKNYIDSI